MLAKFALLQRCSIRNCSTLYKVPSQNSDDTNKYPHIQDLKPNAIRRRKENAWYQKIERQPSVEEKLFEINVPRYWGWKCLMLKEGEIPYNSLAFTQYVTRTHLLDSNDFPLNQYKEVATKISGEIKGFIEDEIYYQLSVKKRSMGLNECSELEEDIVRTKLVVNAINRVLMREVSRYASHLLATEVDYDPRIEAFWSIGGLDPPETVKKRRKAENKVISDEEINAPIDRWVQYLGKPVLQVRSKKLLAPIWEESIDGEVPVWTLEPEVLGFQNAYRYGTSIPGFWPGTDRSFGLISYHLSNHLRYRPKTYEAEESNEALQAQAILASFGWLVPLAAYHGFSPFSNVTYPMLTQSVLTDGKQFRTCLYQLNTNAIYSEFATDNPKTNICWLSRAENLYDRIEGDKIVGFNEEVLVNLISLYLNEPNERAGVNLQPYLGNDVQRVAHYEDEEKRCWLENQFKYFSANKGNHRKDLMYEMYEWERIYKVEHDTRPMDPRRRPFELNQRPYQRKMSDHPGKYIPRGIRPDKEIPKWRQNKFEKTFYPQ